MFSSAPNDRGQDFNVRNLFGTNRQRIVGEDHQSRAPPGTPKPAKRKSRSVIRVPTLPAFSLTDLPHDSMRLGDLLTKILAIETGRLIVMDPREAPRGQIRRRTSPSAGPGRIATP